MGSTTLAELARAGLILGAAAAAVGAAAAWTARGPWHWFLRASLLVVLLAVSRLVFPDEGMLILTVEAAAVVVGLKGIQIVRPRLRARAGTPLHEHDEIGRFQYTLRDLLLAVIVVAWLAALMARVPTRAWAEWKAIGLFGLLFGFMALLTLLVVFTAARERRRSVEKLGWPLSKGQVRACLVAGLMGFAIAIAIHSLRRTAWSEGFVGILVNLSLIALLLALFGHRQRRKQSRVQHRSDEQPVATQPKPVSLRQRVVRVVLAVVWTAMSALCLCAIAALYLMSLPTTETPVPLPAAPGYTKLIEAGILCGKAPTLDVWTASRDDLARHAEQNTDALKLARHALELACYVPVQYTQADLNRDGAVFRDLGRAFVVEARLAELDGRLDDAVRIYRDLIRLGHAIARGGLSGDGFIGWSIEYRGVMGLWQIHGRMTPGQLQELLDFLRHANAEREPLDELYGRELAWDQHSHNTPMRMLLHMVDWDPLAESWEAAEGCGNICRARLRLLICHLAIGLYAADDGSPPEALADLVPDYLRELPKDPFTGEPFIYRTEPDGHVLYSVGPDGRDDGGKPMDRGWHGDVLVVEPSPAEDGEDREDAQG